MARSRVGSLKSGWRTLEVGFEVSHEGFIFKRGKRSTISKCTQLSSSSLSAFASGLCHFVTSALCRLSLTAASPPLDCLKTERAHVEREH